MRGYNNKKAFIGDILRVTEAEHNTTKLLNDPVHSQLIVAPLVYQVHDMADSERRGTCSGAIGNYSVEDDCQDTNIQSERYQKVGAPTVDHIDKIVLSVSLISGCTDNTSSANSICKDLSQPQMSTLANNNTSRNTTWSVTSRLHGGLRECGDRRSS